MINLNYGTAGRFARNDKKYKYSTIPLKGAALKISRLLPNNNGETCAMNAIP
jgi:hypothetical protein